MLNVNNRNTRTRCEICSKLTIKIPVRRHWTYFTPCSSVSIVIFEHVMPAGLNAGTKWFPVIRPKICGNYAFPENFHTRKPHEITVFSIVMAYIFIDHMNPIMILFYNLYDQQSENTATIYQMLLDLVTFWKPLDCSFSSRHKSFKIMLLYHCSNVSLNTCTCYANTQQRYLHLLVI